MILVLYLSFIVTKTQEKLDLIKYSELSQVGYFKPNTASWQKLEKAWRPFQVLLPPARSLKPVFRGKHRNTGFFVTYPQQFKPHFCSSVCTKNRCNAHEMYMTERQQHSLNRQTMTYSKYCFNGIPFSSKSNPEKIPVWLVEVDLTEYLSPSLLIASIFLVPIGAACKFGSPEVELQ